MRFFIFGRHGKNDESAFQIDKTDSQGKKFNCLEVVVIFADK